eukprot:55478-Pelagomonas_calceolata.AAC.1
MAEETRWLRITACAPSTTKLQNRSVGITRLQNLAVRSIFVFKSAPSGNKSVGILRSYLTEWAGGRKMFFFLDGTCRFGLDIPYPSLPVPLPRR